MSMLNPSLVAGELNRSTTFSKFSGEHPEKDPLAVGYGGALHAAGQRTHPGPAVPLHSSAPWRARLRSWPAQPGIHLENILPACQQEFICLTYPSDSQFTATARLYSRASGFLWRKSDLLPNPKQRRNTFVERTRDLRRSMRTTT